MYHPHVNFATELQHVRARGGELGRVASKYDVPSHLSAWADIEAWLDGQGASDGDKELIVEVHRRWTFDTGQGL